MPVIRLLASLALLLVVGCRPDAGSAPVAAEAPATTPTTSSSSSARKESGPVFYQDHALTGLPRIGLWVGARELKAEVAYTLTHIATGLMHRKSIGTNDAMLFLFGSARDRSFYMRNVPFDIDAAYIDDEGVITEVVRLKAMDEVGIPSKSQRIQFVLETAPDFLKGIGAGPGTLIRTEKGTLKETLGGLAQIP